MSFFEQFPKSRTENGLLALASLGLAATVYEKAFGFSNPLEHPLAVLGDSAATLGLMGIIAYLIVDGFSGFPTFRRSKWKITP